MSTDLLPTPIFIVDDALRSWMNMSIASSRLHIAWYLLLGFIAVNLVLKRLQDNDTSRCKALLTRGRWSHDLASSATHLEWHPAGCMKPDYNAHSNIDAIQRCLAADVTLIGDSSVREFYPAPSPKANDSRSEHQIWMNQKHANISENKRTGTLQFLWDPYLNVTQLSALKDTKDGGEPPHAWTPDHGFHTPKFAVVGGGLWHARYLNFSDDDPRLAFSMGVTNLLESRKGLAEREAVPVFLPVYPPYYPWLDSDRQLTITPIKIKRLNRKLGKLSKEYAFDVFWAGIKMTRDSAAFKKDGLHHTDFVANKQREVLLTNICPRMHDHTCCSKPIDIVHGQWLVLAMVTLATIGAIIHKSPTARAGGTLAAVLVYCFFADRTMFFERVNKLVDQQLFVFWSFVALGIGMTTMSPCTDDGILSREHTLEWKGWMQVVILLYHYFGMSKVESIYRIVRLLVGAYLFLTGYGHATYFIRTKDFSFRRVAAVLLRTNLLSCMLPFTMNTYYQFYYFPLLTSIWFLITWATIPSNLNWYSSIRILYSAVLVTLGYNTSDRLFRLLFRLGLMQIDVKEFKFRFGLDLYAAYSGMVLAVAMALCPRGWEMTSQRSKYCLYVAIIIAMAVYLTHAGTSRREEFNENHRFYSIIPITLYAIARNAIPAWRQRYSRFFVWFGRHSLETFILQYHLWLAADTHGILHLGVIDRVYEGSTRGSWRFWAEVFLVTACFLWVCSAASKASAAIVKAILQTPEDLQVANEKDPELILFSSHHDVQYISRFAVRSKWRAMSVNQQLRWKCLAIAIGLYLLNLFWPWRS